MIVVLWTSCNCNNWILKRNKQLRVDKSTVSIILCEFYLIKAGKLPPKLLHSTMDTNVSFYGLSICIAPLVQRSQEKEVAKVLQMDIIDMATVY